MRRVQGVENIMSDIYLNGPVSVVYKMRSDFTSQTRNDGIYIDKGATSYGGHAVVFVGWGVRNGVKYWEV